MKKNILKTILLTISILFVGVTSVNAGFGVSPTNIFNEFLKPGAHFETTIVLSRSNPQEDMQIVIEPSLGDIDSWFKYDQGLTFLFPKGETRKSFNVIVDVPQDASYTTFDGVIRVKAMSTEGQVQGVSIVEGARLDVDLVTTEENISDLLIRSLVMLDSVDGEPLKLEIVAENLGNVEVTPTAKIVIKDMLMQELEVLEDNNLESVKPNETKTMYASFSTQLPEGEYFVETQVLLNGEVLREERLVFRIVGQRPADESDSNVGTQLISFIKDKGVYVGFGIAVASLIFVIFTLLWKTEKMVPKKIQKWAPLLGSKVFSRVLISLMVSILVTVFIGTLASVYSLSATKEKEDIPVTEQETQASIPVVEDTVKGASTISKYVPDTRPFVVNITDENGKVKYPVYTEPDLKSTVIYYASEDEKFDVMEERENWFKVSIGGETYGWLEGTMVKDQQVVQR